MPKELRVNLHETQLKKLGELGNYWGYKYRAETIAHLVNRAHDDAFCRADWTAIRGKAYRVLMRLKPNLVFRELEISQVLPQNYGDWWVVTIGENSSYKISRKEWEQP